MSIPSPPRLSCDSKKCLSGTKRKSKIRNVVIDELRSPKDLPGDAKESINVDSFFPYDESSSTRSNTPDPDISPDSSESVSSSEPQNSSEDTVNNVTSSTEEEMSHDNISFEDTEGMEDDLPSFSRQAIPVQQVTSPQEAFLVENKFLPMKTFVLGKDGDHLQYLVQFSSFYGDTFFISYKDRTIMGTEKIILYEVSTDKIPLIVSENMSERLSSNMKVITLYESSVFYQGKTYSQSSSTASSRSETHNPSTYPVIDEKYIEDPIELAMKAHSESLEIDSMYRCELKWSYNSCQDEIYALSRRVEDHHDIFKAIDALNIEESDKYYDDFVRRYTSDNPIPPDENIKRIRFLNETSNRYVQAHFIFWNRIRDRIKMARAELEETVSSIYVQMSKDYPDIEGIPVDTSIDISRSYPGKIFSKDL